ncbi:hypothetical protein B0H14DRAFT_3548922 [Mycena olivaceomarginata]|nr:hypothetical protein B0H14DRAFT_3548922 [Mycena olivaceomarginata]
MIATHTVPSYSKVLVVGGGPGGSYTAAALAREGIDVVLLEASKFPSMLPSLRHFLRFIDAERKVEEHGFQKKPGAAILFNQWKQEGYTKFGENNHSWNVVRSELDEILLRHAEECGAKVYEEHKVTELVFTEGSNHRPISARFTTGSGEVRSITFDYLVDASGRAGIMSTKYLKNRHLNETLKNIACWAYFRGANMYAPGTDRENAPWFEALTDESGWAWFIPLRDSSRGNVVSVGFVMDSKVSAAKKAAGSAAAGDGSSYTLQDHYLAQFAFVPRLKKLLGDAELCVDATGQTATVKSASDFSYTAASYAGDHFRLVGDASAFIDPFFSSGVHLAVSGGLTAAVTIAASIRQHCSEEEAGKFHDHKVAVSYTRFLLTVLGAYKQIRNQQVAVLSDIDEGNFDRAFDLIRPVIQGTADAGQMLTEDELQKAMVCLPSVDFVTHIFVPTDPEMQERIIKPANATKSISDFYTGPERLLGEVVNGLVGCTKVGCLGLVRVSEKSQVRRK